MPELTEYALNPDPVEQFAAWYRDALDAHVLTPDAMTLATASAECIPSARMVLLKSFDESGFVFYTNYLSEKGRELAENPHAALVFYWAELERQVRIAGLASKLSRAESAAYFQSRPIGHRLGAWTSKQSTIIPSRGALERRFEHLQKIYAGREIPLPPSWGGYRVWPETFEFWRGRPNRLHDRFRYVRRVDNVWVIERLAP